MLAKPTPTPSKGALRVLRQIAYASTFGGTALMMEDRRRRIRLAREVQNNAKKLKSCRQYYGAVAVAEYDSQVFPEPENQYHLQPSPEDWYRHAPVLPSEVQKAYESVERSRLRPSRGTPTSPPSSKTTHNPYLQTREGQSLDKRVIPPGETRVDNQTVALDEHAKRQDVRSPDDLATQAHIEPSVHPCDSIARRINSLLKKKDLSAAGKAYFGYFEGDPTGRAANRNFLKAALRLSFASEKAGNSWMVQRIHDQLLESELPSPRAKIEELLATSKVSEAITLFLRVFEKKQSIHEKTVDLASRLCLAALPLKLYEEIEVIFWRVNSSSAMRADCWEYALEALAKRREHGQVRVVYSLLKGRFPLSKRGYELVIRAMAAQSRLEDLQQILQLSLQAHGQAADHGYVIVLEESWRVTKNFARTRNIFEEMQQWSPDFKHTVSSYNAMISICVDAGRESEARDYLHQMTKDQGLLADVSTQFQFMLAEASKGDWKTVDVMLSHIKDEYRSGMTSSDAKSFLFTINRLLKEHLKHFTARETEDFLWNIVNKHDLVPSSATSEIIVIGYVRSGDLISVFRWIQSVQKYGLSMNSAMASAMFKHYWRTNKVDHKRLWYIYRDLKSIDKGLVSEQFLNVMRDAISYDIRKRRPLARKSHIMAGRLTSLSREHVNTDIYDRKSTQRQMLLAMSLNNPLKAVQIYEASKVRGLPLDSLDLEIAVECSIRANRGSLDAAVELLQSAQEGGMNVQGALTPILIHGTYKDNQTGNELTRTALDFYSMLEKSNIRVKHHVAVATANKLVSRGDPRGALDLLSNVSRLPLAEKKPLDIVGMTIFLRAYGALKDLVGVEWVVKTVLQKDLRVDKLFLSALGNVRKPILALKKTLTIGSDSFENCTRLLELLYVWRLEMRQKMADMNSDAKRQGRELVEVVKSLHAANQSHLAPEVSFQSPVRQIYSTNAPSHRHAPAKKVLIRKLTTGTGGTTRLSPIVCH